MKELWSDAKAKICEQAVEILQKTRDGEDLEPYHLYLTQCAVNEQLTDEGMQKFQQIYQQVMSGKYEKPWLFGIENLTRNNAGYVFWKGHQVEHFTFYNEGSREHLFKWSKELVKRCEFLASKGIAVNCGTVVWEWERILEDLANTVSIGQVMEWVGNEGKSRDQVEFMAQIISEVASGIYDPAELRKNILNYEGGD